MKLKKKKIHSRLLDTRLIRANSALLASLAIYNILLYNMLTRIGKNVNHSSLRKTVLCRNKTQNARKEIKRNKKSWEFWFERYNNKCASEGYQSNKKFNIPRIHKFGALVVFQISHILWLMYHKRKLMSWINSLTFIYFFSLLVTLVKAKIMHVFSRGFI